MRLPPNLKIRRQSPASQMVIFLLLIAFFLVLNLTGFSREIKNFFYLISSPIQKGFWSAGDRLSDFFEIITEMRDLKKENEKLKLEIQELLAENLSLKELKKENEILREALGVGLKKEFKLMMAQVIGRDISSDTLLIDQGFKAGLKKDLPVITQKKILVGKISQVYQNFSKVQLITNRKISFSAQIQDKDISGLVKGKGNLRLLFDLIPQEKEIKKGDLVITSALGGIFPAGLLVGEIEKVSKSDIEIWQKAQIKPAFNFKELETLFIITEF